MPTLTVAVLMFAACLQGGDRPQGNDRDESAVLEFVREQHPELAQVLSYLRANNAPEFERAIRDMGKAIERFRGLKGRDPKRYDLELRHWQVGSRAELLAARNQMEPRDEYKMQLRDLLAEQIDLKRAMVTLERDRTEERLRKLEEQLAEMNDTRDETLDRRVQLLSKKRPEKGRAKATEKSRSPEKNLTTKPSSP